MTVLLFLFGQTLGEHWYSEFFVPAWILGVAVSRNWHAPNLAVFWLATYLMLVATFYLLSWPLGFLIRLAILKRHREDRLNSARGAAR